MKRILSHLQENWIRYGFETLVVTISILGAFTLNNWNDDRKDAIEEQVILKQLYEDLQNSKQHSNELIKKESVEISYLILALGSPVRVDSLLSATNSHGIVRSIFWDFQHEIPIFREFDDINGSGKSSQIKSQLVRAELSKLEAQIAALTYLLNDRRTVHTMRIDAISVEDLNFLALFNREDLDIMEGAATDYRELLKGQRIRNLIGIKLELATAALAARKELHEQIIAVLNALEQNIK